MIIKRPLPLIQFALAAVLLWGLSAAPALAVSVLVHQSTENFYDSGGTGITGCMGLGCPALNFNYGDVSGSITWEIQEKAFQDKDAGTFSISYTVFNDTLASTPITSLHVQNGGMLADSWTAPSGWTFSQDANGYTWTTDDAALYGVPQHQSLDTMQVIFNDPNLDIGFRNANYDYINDQGQHVTVDSSDWYASSPTPEPGTLLLLGSGLIGFGYLSRRRRRLG